MQAAAAAPEVAAVSGTWACSPDAQPMERTNRSREFCFTIRRMPDDSVFHDWRAADKEAHAQERMMAAASLLALEGKGASPPDSEREKARTLRQSADALFQRAMQELRLRISRIKGS